MERPVRQSDNAVGAGSDVSVRIEGAVGRLTLCRAPALNALTHPMVLALESAMLDWQNDDAVALVLIDAQGDKAFCAGGDVNALYRQGIAGDIDSARCYWRDEYRLNALIAAYPKPFVAVMDGIVMGGGIGLSAHGSHRLVTERSMLALPECSIGLVPDVGSTHLLARAPGHLGEYLALTGQRLDASDALHARLADHLVPVARLDALKNALVGSGDTDAIDSFCVMPADSTLTTRASDIDEVFGAATLVDTIAALERRSDPWAMSTLESIARGSPLSLHLAFELVRQARAAPGIAAALQREYRFVSRAMQDADFLEGVRAAMIDKDRQPRWTHASISDVPRASIARLQDVAPDGDLDLHVGVQTPGVLH